MDWKVPLGLFVLAVLPLIPGYIRMAELAGGPALMSENPRTEALLVPLILHVIGATGFYIFGGLQVSATIRRRWLQFHRWTGRLILPFGLTLALTGIWMTLLSPFLPKAPESTDSLYAIRLVVGFGMVASLALGLAAILRRDIASHRAWMTRAYALGLGAATQVLLMLPVAPFGMPSPIVLTLLMGLAWAINLAIAEWAIRRRPLGVAPRAAIRA